MTQSSVLPIAVATAVLAELQALLALSSQPCRCLREQVETLSGCFLSQPVTPLATLEFEKALRQVLDECGRRVAEVVYNHIEPPTPQDTPKHRQRDGQDYCRKNQKSPTRGGIATLF